MNDMNDIHEASEEIGTAEVSETVEETETVEEAEESMVESVELTELTPEIRLLEAVIFASGEPVTTSLLTRQLPEGSDIDAMLKILKAFYAPRGVNLVETAGEWSFRTAPDISPYMKITRQPRRKLPRAASEVLAIIAYHQPVTRADIESIRGVDTSKGTLDVLLELGWVRPGKRRDTPGRPLTWHTTSEFLSHFNITSLKDLPGLDELKAAGLLDARLSLSTMPRESDDGVEAEVAEEDNEYEQWIADAEPETEAPVAQVTPGDEAASDEAHSDEAEAGETPVVEDEDDAAAAE